MLLNQVGELVGFKFQGRWRIGSIKSAEYDAEENLHYVIKNGRGDTFLNQRGTVTLKDLLCSHEMEYLVRRCS